MGTNTGEPNKNKVGLTTGKLEQFVNWMMWHWGYKYKQT